LKFELFTLKNRKASLMFSFGESYSLSKFERARAREEGEHERAEKCINK
jgi:hypothetical protein